MHINANELKICFPHSQTSAMLVPVILKQGNFCYICGQLNRIVSAVEISPTFQINTFITWPNLRTTISRNWNNLVFLWFHCWLADSKLYVVAPALHVIFCTTDTRRQIGPCQHPYRQILCQSHTIQKCNTAPLNLSSEGFIPLRTVRLKRVDLRLRWWFENR